MEDNVENVLKRRKYSFSDKVPSTLLIVLLGSYLLLAYFAQLVEDDMPRTIRESEVSRDDSNTFSEETAYKYLHIIQGDQPRVAGTKYHLQKTVDLKALVDSVAGQARLPVHTDWQFVTGDYFIGVNRPNVNIYQNVSNIVAMLEGDSGLNPNGTTNASVLINCHYDSVPYALGTSDNAIFCAAMVETLARLSRRHQRFKQNIIFLFNGAEENSLQGSHGFLAHPWAHGVTSVVNLDAAGMNGKPTVFQVTDPRVLSAYGRSVWRPSAQSVGELLFASGIIPSDTDFRIWRDFGHMYGVDIAFVKWSHVYHTRYDRTELVRPGVLQGAGGAIQPLLAELADTPPVEGRQSPSPAVYYDYLNLFMISYSLPMSIVVDSLIVVVALLSVAYYVWLVGLRWSTGRELLFAMFGRIVAVFGGELVVSMFTLFTVATTTQLRYLSQPWLVVPLYWIPYTIGVIAVSHAYDAWRTRKSGLNRTVRTLQAAAASRAWLAAGVIALLGARAHTLRYAASVPLLLLAAAAAAEICVVKAVRLAGWQHLLLNWLLTLPAITFLLPMFLRLDAILLPTMGRSPNDSPDYLVAGVNVAMAVLLTSTLSGMELLFSRKHLWLVLSGALAACGVFMLVPFSPYQDQGPALQRHYWFHSEVVSYSHIGTVRSRSTGVVILKQDAYNVDRAGAVWTRDRRSAWMLTEQCETELYCGAPVFRPSMANSLRDSLWIDFSPPAPFTPPPSLQMTSRSCDNDNCTLQFVMNGPAHNLLTLRPVPGATVSGWSLAAPARPTLTFDGQPVYTLVHATGTYSDTFAPFEFSVYMQVPRQLQSYPTQESPTREQAYPLIEISHHAHKIHHPEDFTAEYKEMLHSAPAYFNVATFLSIRSNYVF